MSFQLLCVIISYPIRGIKIKYIYIYVYAYNIHIPHISYVVYISGPVLSLFDKP